MIQRWDAVPMKREETVVTLLRETYRFLAPRYMPVMEWVRISHPGTKRKDLKANTSVVW